jgi:RNA polymerase sigma factor (sigma-70 family)
MQLNTKQLVKECIKNNAMAQRTVYDMFSANMLGLCYRYTKSIHDAEDVLQEGFIKVFKNIGQFKFEGELGAWIRRIMVNTALTYINKHARYRNEQIIEDHLLHAVVDNDVEIDFDLKELANSVRQLPSNYQTIFNLVAIEGYSQVEAAELLHQNVNTVRSQYSRARTQLIALLQKKEIIKNNVN